MEIVLDIPKCPCIKLLLNLVPIICLKTLPVVKYVGQNTIFYDYKFKANLTLYWEKTFKSILIPSINNLRI